MTQPVEAHLVPKDLYHELGLTAGTRYQLSNNSSDSILMSEQQTTDARFYNQQHGPSGEDHIYVGPGSFYTFWTEVGDGKTWWLWKNLPLVSTCSITPA